MPSSMGAQNNTKRAANAVPQPLPPSVEEAYRRKCCQLRHRYNQMEDHNDAARLRLHRLRRQLDKLRVERAFLLEQVAKRTSMNVEDSEGSPSPPPTPRQPKEKPLRIKRGHRKPSALPDLDKDTTPQQPPSPSSETSRVAANGATGKSAATEDADSSPFMLYVCETGQGPEDAESLRPTWEAMDKAEREGWEAKFEEREGRKEKEEDTEVEGEGDAEPEIEAEVEGEAEEGDDVEMGKGDKEGSEEKEKDEEEDVEMGEADDKK